MFYDNHDTATMIEGKEEFTGEDEFTSEQLEMLCDNHRILDSDHAFYDNHDAAIMIEDEEEFICKEEFTLE